MSETSISPLPSGEFLVSLSDEDYRLAQQWGERRVKVAVERGSPGRAGCIPNNVGQDVDGAAAEIAFARLMGAALVVTDGPTKLPDVGCFHVRSTPRPNGKLIVRPEDSEHNLYVLVVGTGRRWRVVGSGYGYQARFDKFWFAGNERPGCYMLPQEYLTPIRPQRYLGVSTMDRYEGSPASWLEKGVELTNQHPIKELVLRGTSSSPLSVDAIRQLAKSETLRSLQRVELHDVTGEENSVMDVVFATHSTFFAAPHVEVWMQMGPDFEHGQPNGWQRREGGFYRFGMDVFNNYEGDKHEGEAPWRNVKRKTGHWPGA